MTNILLAKGKTKKEFTEEVLTSLENGVKGVYSSERWKQFLEYNSKFHRYSANNIVLMLMQNPNATRVASMSTWNKLGRTIIKGQGALGMKILAPRTVSFEVEKKDENGNVVLDEDGNPIIEKEYKVTRFAPVSVYDISQTEGKEPPDISHQLIGANPEKDVIIEALQKIVDPTPIVFEQIDGDANGYYSSSADRIAIKDGMSDIQTIKTAIHEVAHCVLHNPNSPTAEADRETKEIQAESVAFSVCKSLNIDTSEYTFPYVAGWASGKELSVLKDNIDIICSTANDIYNEVEEYLAEHKVIKTTSKELLNEVKSEIAKKQKAEQGYEI